MDLQLFDEVADFLDVRLDDESANPTGRYTSRAEAFKDIEAKVRIMNRAREARDLVRSFPDDAGASTMLTAYGTVLRHLAEVYNRYPDYQRRWGPEDI
ncbi:hypothetical protein FNH05_09730 [Amycolatopsis rhizosphaerae]|uniref:Uncharacterized protein n=1 Tax=Amycolatopsis rhizosphaerae TaxID=2053003 RepID=A0A558D2T8_9PSEU|nr:DUF6221 family protein [Amycolatopsis rhizosphaerae]TVT55328.1 hypothetical protein FNH05_09730 [Amycolatopsis rhizosphaerae]